MNNAVSQAKTEPKPIKPLGLIVDKKDTFQVRLNVPEVVTSLTSKGVARKDVCSFMKDNFDIELSAAEIHEMISEDSDSIREWQDRPLARLYPIIYLDGTHFRIRNNARIMKKCAYVALGINEEGMKEVLGIWIDESERASLWSKMLTDLKNRGVEDILIACADNLTGFAEVIHSMFPNTDIQQCIVHQVRNTMKHLPIKDREKICMDLRSIYNAPTEESGHAALEVVEKKWAQYGAYFKSWHKNWANLATFFAYSPLIRKMIYTTNPIESLNSQFKRVTKSINPFPDEDLLIKRLWLAQQDISKKWRQPLQRWGETIMELAGRFPERISID